MISFAWKKIWFGWFCIISNFAILYYSNLNTFHLKQRQIIITTFILFCTSCSVSLFYSSLHYINLNPFWQRLTICLKTQSYQIVRLEHSIVFNLLHTLSKGVAYLLYRFNSAPSHIPSKVSFLLKILCFLINQYVNTAPNKNDEKQNLLLIYSFNECAYLKKTTCFGPKVLQS